MQSLAYGVNFEFEVEQVGEITCATLNTDVQYEVGFVSRPGRYLAIDAAVLVSGETVRDHDYMYHLTGVGIRHDYFKRASLDFD